ncbi:MAG: RNase P subunit p30 family protein [Candidatus Nanohaloarchaea archaeon]
MPDFYDLCLEETSEEIGDKARDIGWKATNRDFDTVFLEADDWGELKRKIKSERKNADVLVFRGGDEELNRKAASDSRIDIILRPEKGRKDSGINHVIAEIAAENRVAIGFDLKQLFSPDKHQSHILKHWMRNIELCEKYDTPYIITSGAEKVYDLRAPRDLASLIESLGGEGMKAVSDYPEQVLERAERVSSEGFVRPGEVEE